MPYALFPWSWGAGSGYKSVLPQSAVTPRSSAPERAGYSLDRSQNPYAPAWAPARRTPQAPYHPPQPRMPASRSTPGCRFEPKSTAQRLVNEQCYSYSGKKFSKNRYEVCPPGPDVECVDSPDAGMSFAKSAEIPMAKAISSAVAADLLRSPNLIGLIRSGRMSATQLRNAALRDIERDVKREPGRREFPALIRVIRTQMNVEEAKLRGGLSQWDAIASMIGMATSAATTYVKVDSSKDLAKLELQKQQLALQSAQISANAANLNLATSQGQPAAAGGGSWAVPALVVGGVAAAAVGGYLLLRRRR